MALLLVLLSAGCGGGAADAETTTEARTTAPGAAKSRNSNSFTKVAIEETTIPAKIIEPSNTPLPSGVSSLGEGGEGYSFEQFFAAAPEELYFRQDTYDDDGNYTATIVRRSLDSSDTTSEFYMSDSIYFSGITSENIFITEYSNIYMISRKTKTKTLLEEDICGIAFYNPANQTLYYGEDVYDDQENWQRVLVRAKNLATGKVTDLYPSEYGYAAFFGFAGKYVYCYINYADIVLMIDESLKAEELAFVEDSFGHDFSRFSLENFEPWYAPYAFRMRPKYVAFQGQLYFLERAGNWTYNFYRMKPDGSGKKLLRKDTHLRSLCATNGKLYGLAEYILDEPEDYKDTECVLHELDAEGKPLSSLHRESFGMNGGHIAYAVGDLLVLGVQGWESNIQYYSGIYDTRTGKFYS